MGKYIRLTPREQQLIALVRGMETLPRDTALQTHKAHLSPKQKKLLEHVHKHPAGITYEALLKTVTDVGYKSPNCIGGFFKGENATLAKVTLPAIGERVFLSERGQDLLKALKQTKEDREPHHV